MNEYLPVSSLEDNLKKALTELLVLFLLCEQDRYIGELTALINQRSKGILTIVFPYAAIYRLQEDGYIREIGKRTAPDGRRRQYFAITESGRDHLEQLLKTYASFSQGVDGVLGERGESENEQ